MYIELNYLNYYLLLPPPGAMLTFKQVSSLMNSWPENAFHHTIDREFKLTGLHMHLSTELIVVAKMQAILRSSLKASLA